MATQFKVLIIGGGIAGLSLAIILEAYGFDYELLEKHAEIAPKLGAGVGITPNGARILDQMGVWDEMCDYSSPVDAGTALSPEGQTVIFNPNMGDWLLKLFGYKIHFLSRHDCLRILLAKVQRKSCIHLRQEVVGIKTVAVGQRARAETKDGSVFTGDIVVGADGVRSTAREQLWKMADTERPGYIPKEDKTGIMSFYTAVIGVAHDPGLPEGGSARAYNRHRSYFFQEGRKGSREFYWWLCAKNETTKSGIIPKLSSEAKQQLLDRYADDRIGESLTLGSLSKMSTYSFIIPLQDFVLKKCFYKNIILIGDTFRKLHPVAGQGANSAIEESAFLADILWNLRATNAIHEPYALEQALEEFQRERFVRGKALQEDANLVQRMESLDNPVMKFMSLYVVPRLPFVVAFLPQLACSFIPARHLKHLPPPKQAMVAFSQDMKATISPRSNLATSFWAGTFILSALSPYMMSRFFGAEIERLAMDESAKLSGIVELYLAFIAISVSGVWVVESYKASFLISPLTSALVWILASNYWGWEKTVPLYFCLHALASQSVGHYYTPQTMTDVGTAKALMPALLLVYWGPAARTLGFLPGSADGAWGIAHCALPVAAYVGGIALKAVSSVPQGVDAVFSNIDQPYQYRFQTVIAVAASLMHISLSIRYGAAILDVSFGLLSLPALRALASLSAVTTSWCLYSAWELRRIKATDVSISRAWAIILLSTCFIGPAATLANTFGWYKAELAGATSFERKQKPVKSKSP